MALYLRPRHSLEGEGTQRPHDSAEEGGDPKKTGAATRRPTKRGKDPRTRETWPGPRQPSARLAWSRPGCSLIPDVQGVGFLGDSCQGSYNAVAAQEARGERRGLPWDPHLGAVRPSTHSLARLLTVTRKGRGPKDPKALRRGDPRTPRAVLRRTHAASQTSRTSRQRLGECGFLPDEAALPDVAACRGRGRHGVSRIFSRLCRFTHFPLSGADFPCF